MHKIKILLSLLFFASLCLSAQNYTKQDTLNDNSVLRNWWDVLFYNITVEPNIKDQSIVGKVSMKFRVSNKNSLFKMQIDLQKPMEISAMQISFVNDNTKTTIPIALIERKDDFYFIDLSSFKNQLIAKDAILEMTFFGFPKIAKNAPWQGGWVFKKDKSGNPWISVACQGDGASLWYPNKDYWGDKPNEGAQLNIIVPNDLVGIGNGKLIKKELLLNNKTQYSWLVTNPINNYNLVPYIGKYANFFETFNGKEGLLNLDYWVLEDNLELAKDQFKQVAPMLQCFEDWLGPYPFYKDNYKLVESPYLGMEHQSNIAYGNEFKNGYLGNDLSNTGWGLKWDYIIIHESGHEWFGNAISAKNPADMWLHESFTTYTEALYTECQNGKKAGNEYVIGLRRNIKNDNPIMGDYATNKEGSMDMYPKGANMIHTFRQIINNDVKFKSILKALISSFKNKTITKEDFINKINELSSKDYSSFFNQYLKTTELPRLLYKKNKQIISYKWDDSQIYPQQIPIKLSNQTWLYPTTKNWKKIKLQEKEVFKIDSNFYITTKKIK